MNTPGIVPTSGIIGRKNNKKNRMKMSKKQGLAALAIALAVAGAGIGAVNAASDDSGKTNPMSTLVQAIADKFNLNKDEVQAVFDDQEKEMQAERKTQMAEMEVKMKQNLTDRLAKAVKDGNLTQDQADLITAKNAELEAARKDSSETIKGMKTMTEEERTALREKMQAQRDALKTWAKENGISEEYLPMMGGGMGGHRGPGFGGSDGEPGPAPDTSSQD